MPGGFVWVDLSTFDLKRNITYFIEPVPRRTHPVLYWAIVVTWLWLSVYLLAEPFWG